MRRLSLLLIACACTDPVASHERVHQVVRTPATGRLACFGQQLAYEPDALHVDCTVAYENRDETLSRFVPQCDRDVHTGCFQPELETPDCAGRDGLSLLGDPADADHITFACW